MGCGLVFFLCGRILYIKHFKFKGVLKISKGKNKKETKFIYSEEFITTTTNPTEKDLKTIFNKKYFEYIKRLENRTLGG